MSDTVTTTNTEAANTGQAPAIVLLKPKRNSCFEVQVNCNIKTEMQAFLSQHLRYPTFRSPKKTVTSYANCVKIHVLNVPKRYMKNAILLAERSIECPDWDSYFRQVVRAFHDKHGLHIGFNGNRCGYLVLYRTDDIKNPGQDGTYAINATVGVDMDEDFTDTTKWSMKQLQARAKMVRDFDKTCESLRKEFLRICRNYHVIEIPDLYAKARRGQPRPMRKVLVPKGQDAIDAENAVKLSDEMLRTLIDAPDEAMPETETDPSAEDFDNEQACVSSPDASDDTSEP